MIYYLSRSAHSYTITSYLESWGLQTAASFIRPLSYEKLWKTKKLRLGTYIFSDIERLTPEEAEATSNIWQQLNSSEHKSYLLNHPTRSKRRYGLLRSLYSEGINQFNVYRLTEYRQPQKYPVFIRSENDHTGNLTSLLHTPEDLDQAVSQILNSGQSLEDKIITEFFSTVGDDKIFRKYSAFIVGEKIIPRHLFFSKKWMIKSPKLAEKEQLAEEYRYVTENPHESALREIFQMADIQYGRIDYSLVNGMPQVWEINTNPASLSLRDMFSEFQRKRSATHHHFAKRFVSALHDIDVASDPSIRIEPTKTINNSRSVARDISLNLLKVLPYPQRLWIRRQIKVSKTKLNR